jgi:pimeloyl-ACP methyl ester carboxylesterase
MWPAIRWPPGCPTVRRTRNEHRVPVLGCASDGASSGPIPISDPLGVFAGNQLDPMDHLGTRQFLFLGYRIGGCFAHKLMERAPERVVAGALVSPELKARTIDRACAAGLHRGRWSMPER